jgi:hypothetical protein
VFGHERSYFDIQTVWFSYTVYYIDFQHFLYIFFCICIFHSTRINLLGKDHNSFQNYITFSYFSWEFHGYLARLLNRLLPAAHDYCHTNEIKILKIYCYTENTIYNFMARKTDVGHPGKTVLYVCILLNHHLSKITKVIPITSGKRSFVF